MKAKTIEMIKLMELADSATLVNHSIIDALDAKQDGDLGLYNGSLDDALAVAKAIVKDLETMIEPDPPTS